LIFGELGIEDEQCLRSANGGVFNFSVNQKKRTNLRKQPKSNSEHVEETSGVDMLFSNLILMNHIFALKMYEDGDIIGSYVGKCTCYHFNLNR
jgi:hypothetical protein